MIVDAFNETEARLFIKRYYGYSESQYRLSIKKEPVEGIWGIGKKKGEYEVTMLVSQESDKGNNDSKPCNQGYVEINNGVLKIYHPKDCKRYPSIVANDTDIEVYVNGKLKKGVIILTNKDAVKFKPNMIYPKYKVWVDISEDKMEATLNIKIQKGRIYCIKNAERNNSIQIESIFQEVELGKVPFDECLKLVLNSDVKAEFINEEAIKRLIDSPMGGSAIIAKGVHPVQGTKTVIEYSFNGSEVNDIENTLTVQIGDVLAEKMKCSIPGTDGLTVTGEIVKAEEVADEILKAGQGTMLFDNNKKVVATTSGRPALEKGEICVIPIIVLSGDVDKNTGNIIFDGDILIQGNVMDNMKVTATGKIKVKGSVYNAKIFANEDIHIIGKAIGGNIIARMNMMSYYFGLPIMDKIINILNDLLAQLEVHDTDKEDKDFDHMKETIKSYVSELENTLPYQFDNDATPINMIIKKIIDLFYNHKIDIISDIKQINELHDMLTYYIESKRKTYTCKANVTVEYAQGAIIQACGSIIVTGLGSYQSTLVAKDILFKRPTSSVKGGMLVAQKTIKAGTIGSPSGIHTYCRILNKEGKVYAHYYNGTVIAIGDNVKTISKG